MANATKDANRNANKVVWFEILGKDTKRLRGFFSELFGWQYKDAPSMDYGMTDPESTGIGGGIGSIPAGTSWTTFYVSVPDLAATIQRAKAMGGVELMPITKLPDTTLAVIADPEGHPVGLVQG